MTTIFRKPLCFNKQKKHASLGRQSENETQTARYVCKRCEKEFTEQKLYKQHMSNQCPTAIPSKNSHDTSKTNNKHGKGQKEPKIYPLEKYHEMTDTVLKSELEQHFQKFRKNIIGINLEFISPFGLKKVIYVDWAASGRLYRPIEEKLTNDFGPFIANPHTETTITGTVTTLAYHQARNIIKKHVNASADDILIIDGSGTTAAINKFQRILGLRVPENFKKFIAMPQEEKPVVFVSHMEHHSNHTSWLETIAKVVIIPPSPQGFICLDNLKQLLEEHKNYKSKMASITACSNVTGIEAPYYEIAKLMHKYGGLCFVDFACSAPYVKINMHPADEEARLDAIFFSPHKFLGGPGTSGILVFNKNLYKNMVPDHPGGGTVLWTNPWGEHKYVDNIEEREDGGTPAFLQAIKTALAIKLKEEMGIDNIRKREKELIDYVFGCLERIPNLTLLASHIRNRLGVISFYIEELHHHLCVKILNDRFGIQTRGGCSCAGTYGHFLLKIDYEQSHIMTDKINAGDLTAKLGWVRLSIHPTTTNAEIQYVCESIKTIAENHKEWGLDYRYNKSNNEFTHVNEKQPELEIIHHWYEL